MGFFSRIFGGEKPAAAPEPTPEPEPTGSPPAAVIVLRQGMNVPGAEYVEAVLASAFEALPDETPRFGLAQPVWFKTSEIADAAAADVADAFARKLALEGASHRHRTVEGPEGSHVMIVEIRRD
jgi:hypothetical protein